jgi:hypothetical protein
MLAVDECYRDEVMAISRRMRLESRKEVGKIDLVRDKS